MTYSGISSRAEAQYLAPPVDYGYAPCQFGYCADGGPDAALTEARCIICGEPICQAHGDNEADGGVCPMAACQREAVQAKAEAENAAMWARGHVCPGSGSLVESASELCPDCGLPVAIVEHDVAIRHRLGWGWLATHEVGGGVEVEAR